MPVSDTIQLDWQALDGYRFQDLCIDLLSAEGFDVQDQGIGPDGGIDAILVQTLPLPDESIKSVRWAAQFKFKKSADETVKPKELGNVGNLLARFQAQGFFLITNGRVTHKALAELRGALAAGHPPYMISVWTRRHLERRLYRRRQVAIRYFPSLPLEIQSTVTLELVISLPIEKFSDLEQKLFRHALASFLEVPVTTINIKEIFSGSTRVFIELPSDSAVVLQYAFKAGALGLEAYGFHHAIEAIHQMEEPDGETPRPTDIPHALMTGVRTVYIEAGHDIETWQGERPGGWGTLAPWSQEDNLPLRSGIAKLAEKIGRHFYLSEVETMDFVAFVKSRLAENDYAVLRNFQGASSLKTYLTVTIVNLGDSYRRYLWGRWRASPEATRLGPLAVRLERLLFEGSSLDEALEILHTEYGVDPDQLQVLRASLPNRGLWNPGAAPEEAERPTGQYETRERINTLLEQALSELSLEERLIVDLSLRDLPLSSLSVVFKVDQKSLYRKHVSILRRLRKRVISLGADSKDIAAFLPWLEDRSP